MVLKKGDIVAIISKVVEDRDGRVEVKIDGSSLSGVVVPSKAVRLLDRAINVDDKVVTSDGRRGTMFQELNKNVAIILLDGADENSSESYVTVDKKSLVNLNRDGCVSFTSALKRMPNVETGQSILNEIENDLSTEEASSTEEDPIDSNRFMVEEGPSSEQGPKSEEIPGMLRTSSSVFSASEASNASEAENEEFSEAVDYAVEDQNDDEEDGITIVMPDAPSSIIEQNEPTADIENEITNPESSNNGESDKIVMPTGRPKRNENISPEVDMAAMAETYNTIEAEDHEDQAEVHNEGEEKPEVEDQSAAREEKPETEGALDSVKDKAEQSGDRAKTDAAEEEPKRDIESIRKDTLAMIRESEGEEVTEEEEDVFASIDNLDTKLN